MAPRSIDLLVVACCAAHALAGTTPPGVATIEIACEALKLAEWLTPELQKKLKK